MKKIVILLVICSLIPVLLNAEKFAKVGTAGLQFLKLDVDARATGMGGAYTALSDDISSVYWNPGGLAVKFEDQVFFSHTNWVADIYHEYFAVSKVMSFGTMAFSASVLHMDEMEVTEEETFGPTGETFTNSDIALGLTYSNNYTDKFSFGMTVKYLRENLYEYSVNGMSVDVGSQYNTQWKNLTIGMALRNFGPNLKYELDNDDDGKTDEDPFDLLDNDGDGLVDEDREELEFKIPMNFSLGLAADLYENKNSKLIGSFQIDNCVDREETYNLGLEYRFMNFYLRAGRKINFAEADYAAGVGFKMATNFAVFNIDYSYNNMNDLEEDDILSKVHRLTLKMSY